MPVFIIVTNMEGGKVWLNAGLIISMERRAGVGGTPYTEVCTADDDIFVVEEPGEIAMQTKHAIANYSAYTK